MLGIQKIKIKNSLFPDIEYTMLSCQFSLISVISRALSMSLSIRNYTVFGPK